MDSSEIEALARQIAIAVVETIDAKPSDRLGYTIKGAAAAVGLSPGVIRDAISRGEISAVKRGRYWMIRREAMIRWLTPRGR